MDKKFFIFLSLLFLLLPAVSFGQVLGVPPNCAFPGGVVCGMIVEGYSLNVANICPMCVQNPTSPLCKACSAAYSQAQNPNYVYTYNYCNPMCNDNIPGTSCLSGGSGWITGQLDCGPRNTFDFCIPTTPSVGYHMSGYIGGCTQYPWGGACGFDAHGAPGAPCPGGTGTSCTGNGDCSPGMTCKNGKCVSTLCTSNSQCAATGYCNTSVDVCESCTNNSNCSGGQVCKEGKCVAPDTCGTGSDCSSGYCNPQTNICNPCTSDDQCQTVTTCWSGYDCPSGTTCDIAEGDYVGKCTPCTDPAQCTVVTCNTTTGNCTHSSGTDGLCGPDDGGTVSAVPTNSELCSSGQSENYQCDGHGNCTWDCAGTDGGNKSKICQAALSGISDGICGPDNGKSFSTLSSTDSNLCPTGSSVVLGSFYDTGSGWLWNCTSTTGGANSPQCSASVLVITPAPGVCGTANNKHYDYDATDFGSDTFCTSATPPASIPVFPTPGNSVIWTCPGTDGGDPSGDCTAAHDVCPASRQCGTAENPNFCCDIGNVCDTSTTPHICKSSAPKVSNLKVILDPCRNAVQFGFTYNCNGDSNNTGKFYTLQVATSGDTGYANPVVNKTVSMNMSCGLNVVDPEYFSVYPSPQHAGYLVFGQPYIWRVQVGGQNGTSDWTNYVDTHNPYDGNNYPAKADDKDNNQHTYTYIYTHPAPTSSYVLTPEYDPLHNIYPPANWPVVFHNQSMCYTAAGSAVDCNSFSGGCSAAPVVNGCYTLNFGDGTSPNISNSPADVNHTYSSNSPAGHPYPYYSTVCDDELCCNSPTINVSVGSGSYNGIKTKEIPPPNP